jgi:F0F1-type ATP synthase delta subunit
LDSKLIGGFIVRIGDTMFDGSVKRQLELLRKRFAEEITVA